MLVLSKRFQHNIVVFPNQLPVILRLYPFDGFFYTLKRAHLQTMTLLPCTGYISSCLLAEYGLVGNGRIRATFDGDHFGLMLIFEDLTNNLQQVSDMTRNNV